MNDKTFCLRFERIIPGIFRKTDISITSIPLYGDQSFSAELNTDLFTLSIDFILFTKMFESGLLTETSFVI